MEAFDTNAAYEVLAKQKKPSEFKHNMFVLRSLVSKDFKRKYRRSVLGIVWSMLNPLLMMVVMTAVFSYMFRFDIEHYPVYLILGSITFDYMNRGTSSALTSIIDSEALIKKIRIEKMLFPLEKVTFELVNYAIAFIPALGVLAVFQIMPSIHALWGIPFLIICLTMFSVGLGLLVSALSVFFRDVMHLWSVLMLAWMYATPIFYPIGYLPDWMQTVELFNPMYHYVTLIRDFMMYDVNPGGMECLVCFGMAAITFLVGFVVFRKTEDKFILHV